MDATVLLMLLAVAFNPVLTDDVPCPEVCRCRIENIEKDERQKSDYRQSVKCTWEALVKIPLLPTDTAILDISDNSLTTIDDADLPVSLLKVWLDKNGLSSMPSVSKLTNLRRLYLSSNNISNSPDDDQKDLPISLEHLSLFDNSLTSIPPQISKLTNLQYLDVADNKITSIDNTTFSASLYSLDLSGNLLTKIPNLSYLPFLGFLLLGRNNITNSPNNDFPPFMFELDLSHNVLTSIPRVSDIGYLTSLDVSNNNITSIDEAVLPGCLKVLWAFSNRIQTITTLNFNDTAARIQDASILPAFEADAPLLWDLDLRDNPLTSISRDAFKQLKNLNLLSLSETRLTRPPLTLAHLTTSLDILWMEDIPHLSCTCAESGPLKSWITSYHLEHHLFSYMFAGQCEDGTSLGYFFEHLPENCTAHEPK